MLFKGRDYLDQLHCILRVLGTPDPRKDLSFVTKPECRRVIRNMGIKAAVPWSKLFPRAETQALDLLGKLLAWNPVNRITVEEALRHPWLGEYHDESREPSCLVSFDFDNNTSDLAGDLPVGKIRRLMSAEILKMRSEEASERDGSTPAGIARAGEGNRDGPAAVVPAKSRDVPVAPPSVPPTPPPAPPATSSRAPSSYLPIAQEAEIARDISAAATSAVQKDVTGQLKSGVLAEDGLLQSMLRRELEKMEVRILSQMRVVVDQVVTKRLKEFAQALEDEGVGHE